MGLKPLPNALIISDFVSFFANHPAGVVSEFQHNSFADQRDFIEG